jgi:hypothetical protein
MPPQRGTIFAKGDTHLTLAFMQRASFYRLFNISVKPVQNHLTVLFILREAFVVTGTPSMVRIRP